MSTRAKRKAVDLLELKRLFLRDWSVCVSSHPKADSRNIMIINPPSSENVPLPAGCGDEAFLAAFQTKLKPAALEFRPDFVLVSAGFDAHEDDLLGGMRVTSEGFARLTRVVKEIADECCRGRIVSMLEGGYELDGLARMGVWEETIRVIEKARRMSKELLRDPPKGGIG